MTMPRPRSLIVLALTATVAVSGCTGDSEDSGDTDFRFKRLRRVSVKGYSRLEAWRLKRPKGD